MDESVVKQFDQVRLKLSQAIRIGAKMRPQCTKAYFKDGGSCAIGAAYEGMTGRSGGYREIGDLLPELVDDDYQLTLLGELIAGRNDQGTQSREEIADWLEAQGL